MPHVPVSGALDAEEFIASAEPSHRVKGLMFGRFQSALDDEWPELCAELLDPPRRSYLPFRDYPLADYLRLLIRVARRHYPRTPLIESCRLVARSDFDAFAASNLGRVTMALVSDPMRALRTSPRIFRQVATGEWTIEAAPLERGVRIEIVNQGLPWSVPLGTFEGLVQHYDANSRIEVTQVAPKHFRYDVFLE